LVQHCCSARIRFYGTNQCQYPHHNFAVFGGFGGDNRTGSFDFALDYQTNFAATKASQAISSGQLDQTVQVQGIDELESLADSFNQMADSVEGLFH